jgi:hypothetical protein
MKIDFKKDLSMPKLGRPTLPKLGRPSRPGKARGINAAPSGRGRGPEIKAPKIVTDLYGDLRDRHLLPLVVLLIVAIIAAPIVFGGKGGSDEPIAAPNISTGETANSAFTVVPAEASLRSPKKRLGHRHPLNPFRQDSSGHLSPEEEAAVEALTGDIESSAAELNPASSSEPGAVETPAEVTPAEVTPIEVPSSEGSPTESHSPGGAEATETETKTKTETTTESTETTTAQEPQYAVGMKVGFDPKNLQSLEEVQPMTKLPSDKNPAILYIGLSQDHKQALFLLTSKVTAYYGGAHCVLDKLSCELIELKAGSSATFEIGLGEEATRYKIALESIEQIEPGKESAKETKRTEIRSSLPNARALGVGNAQHFSK